MPNKNAMETVAKDYKEGWHLVKDFLNDKNKIRLMFSVEVDFTSYSTKNSYVFVKLPYNKDIFFLYGEHFALHELPLYPGKDLKYVGFFSYKANKAYDPRTPFDKFYGFDDKEYLSEDSLKREARSAIKRAMADIVINSARDREGTLIPNFDGSHVESAEKAFSKGLNQLDFSEKIIISDWSVTSGDVIRFITEPETLIAEKAEGLMKGRLDELLKLWEAHCASQKILDLLIANSRQSGNEVDKDA